MDTYIQVNQTDTNVATLNCRSWPSQEVGYARLYLKVNFSLADWFIKYQQLAWTDFSMKSITWILEKPSLANVQCIIYHYSKEWIKLRTFTCIWE